MKKHHWWRGSSWPSISQRYVTLNQRMRRWSKSFVAFPYPFCQDSTALRHSCATSFGWPIHHISLWQETKWALNRGELPRLAACPLADLAIEHWPFGWALATAVTCHKLQAMRIGTPGKSHLFPWSVDVGSGRELPEIVGCLFFVEYIFLESVCWLPAIPFN